ncbi:hypothetical protein [Effusibacillus dendaii]|uniref:Lipoprotein n=1 Tax=Effusibacillus dendaii TaxID=2743772 RepID=A0A7I8DFB0_9BACL|nr:hypothetical protein [Effusibacillus dendaii]BCJ86601.1 hypothetical protein skT53_15860 [Effusibacillus dendaii]
MKLRNLMMCTVLAGLTAGCQPLFDFNSDISSPNSDQSDNQTFSQVLKHSQNNPLQGKTVAELNGVFDQTAIRFVFVTMDEKPIAVFQGTDGWANVVEVSPDGSLKQRSFPGYKLTKAILNQKILYVGSKGNSIIKLNVDSFNYSEVDKSEMDRARVVTDEVQLPGKETPVYTKEGYIYTKDGFIFDIKNHEYLLDSSKMKKRFYDRADFGYNGYLFQIEPRLDQAINLKVFWSKGPDTKQGSRYGIQLDLPNGYDVKNIEQAIGTNGRLYLFAFGVPVNGKTQIRMFSVPLADFSDDSSTGISSKQQ